MRKNSSVLKTFGNLEVEQLSKSRAVAPGLTSHRTIFDYNYASPVYETAQRLIKHNYKEIKKGYAQVDKNVNNTNK